MRKIIAPLSGIIALCVFVWIAQSGIIQWLGEFLTWYINYQVTTSDLNNAFVLISKILTWIISYSAVGLIFNLLGWFNSKVMSTVYVIVSFFINIALTLFLKFVQDYAWIIGIVFLFITSLLIIVVIINLIKEQKGILAEEKKELKGD
jgi:hypothetical protein